MQKEAGFSRRKRSHEDMSNHEEAQSEHPTASPPNEDGVRSSSPVSGPSENQTQSHPTPPTSGQFVEKPNSSGKSSEVSVEEDEDMDPGHPLDDFNWQDLEERYHGMIEEQNEKESQLQQEFDDLMNVRLPQVYNTSLPLMLTCTSFSSYGTRPRPTTRLTDRSSGMFYSQLPTEEQH